MPALKIEKPDEDRKAFDARQLVLHQAAKDAVTFGDLCHGSEPCLLPLTKVCLLCR